MNTDCVVSIDKDDDPGKSGIIDFAAFSKRDGSGNNTITGYMNSAIKAGEWAACTSTNPQECMINTGAGGMNSYSTLSRKKEEDTDSPDDFILTPYSTPGRDNIINPPGSRNSIAELLSDKIIYKPGISPGIIPIRIMVHKKSSARIRIFNSTGTGIYSSELIKDINPGFFTLEIRASEIKGKKLTGLYPVRLEVYSEKHTKKLNLFLVIIRR
jgi:hypothetical protein